MANNNKSKKSRSKIHKQLVKKRESRLRRRAKTIEQDKRQEICKIYAEGSNKLPMPSIIDALANQELLHDDDFLVAQQRILDWFSKQINSISKQKKKINYLPNKVIAFIIPLDFFLPLPNNYVSGALGYDTNGDNITSASCVTNFYKIVHVGKSAIKVSYLVVSICDNEAAMAIKLKTQPALFGIFETAIQQANHVISSFQAIPTRHNHFIHDITSFSSPSLLQYFIFNRETAQITQKSKIIVRDNVYSDIFQSRPLEKDELNYYKSCHVQEVFDNDKIFELVSILNQATNLRCFGRDNDSILIADKFVEYSLGYFYCEIRILRNETRLDVYSDYVKKDEKVILKKLCQLLNYQDEKNFKQAINYDEWYDKCRSRRNNLIHRFITGDFNGAESAEALYSACQLIRKVCDIVIDNTTNFPEYFISKTQFLKDATEFVVFMHESAKKESEKFCSRSI